MDQEQAREALRKRLLGWGLECELVADYDIGRDLRLVRNESGKLDFATIEGIDNLGQALCVAVTTALGADPFNVSFGFDGVNAISTETNPFMQRERVRIGLVTLLRKEPRVRRIVDIQLQDERLTQPIAGARTVDVRVVFETITADQTALDLGEVQNG